MIFLLYERVQMLHRVERSNRGRPGLAAVEACDYQYPMASEDVLELTDSNFDAEVIKSDVPVLVDFWAVWCGPCKQLTPIVEDMATEYKGTLKVAKLNIDDHMAIPQKFGVRSVPTLLVFKSGQVVAQLVGAYPKSKIEAEVKKYL